MNTPIDPYDERETGRRGGTGVILLVVALVALLLTGPAVLARGALGSNGAPVAGLPAGHPVIGSVNDGVRVPYSLDLKGRSSARVLLSIDGTVVSDVANAPATGAATVPAGSPLLRFAPNAQLSIVAKAPDGTVLDSATGEAGISDGVTLPPKFSSYSPQQDLAPSDVRYVVGGQTVRFLGAVDSGGGGWVPLTSYDLTVDGRSILAVAPKDCAQVGCNGAEWIDGSWTAPTAAGNHTVVLSASAKGDSRLIRHTYTLSVQAQSSWKLDTHPVQVDQATGYHLNTVLRRAEDYQPVPNAPVSVWRSSDDARTWTNVLDTTTDGLGVLDTVLHPDTSSYYKLSTPGVVGMIGPSESPFVHVEVNAKVTLASSTSSVSLPSRRSWTTLTGMNQRTVRFTVTAPSAMAGLPVLLQLWNGLTWNTVSWGTIGTDGTAHLSYVTRKYAGAYKFGVQTGRSDMFAPTTSNDVHIQVR